MIRALIIVALLGGTARAEEIFHIGLDVRTDLGTHHTRLPIGVRWGAWDATAVLDPMYFLDGQHDLDVLGEYFFGSRIGFLWGWRWSAIDVDDGTHHQHRSVLGVTALGPTFFDDRLRTSFSLELATLWVKHGGGVEADWISFDRNFHDSMSLGLFVRIEYAHGN